MEIITFESKAYKELDNKITAIADYIFNHAEMAKQSEEDMWVDSYEVCTFLKISEKTLQRLRVSGTIAYSNIRGRYFYKDADKLLVKPLHIAAYLAVGDAGVNLRSFYICVSQHLGHRFNGYAL